MTDLRLAVIIPHYNDLTRLETCLQALAAQLTAHPEVEVIVIDNNSPVDLAPVQVAFPSIRMLVEAKKGAAAARNRGVAETTAPFLAFLDSDCVPKSDWLVTALHLVGQDVLIGGRVDTFDETPAPKSGAEAFETVFAFHQKAYVEKKGFSVTANLLTSRKVFHLTGPMVPGLAEDVDWCKSATKKGFELRYANELAVGHPTRQDWAALTKKWRRTTNEMFQSNGTDPKGRLSWMIRALTVAASAPAHSPKILGDSRLSSVEKRRGLITLWRLRLTRTGWMLHQVVFGDVT